eukprot:Pgem_evm1s8789
MEIYSKFRVIKPSPTTTLNRSGAMFYSWNEKMNENVCSTKKTKSIKKKSLKKKQNNFWPKRKKKRVPRVPWSDEEKNNLQQGIENYGLQTNNSLYVQHRRHLLDGGSNEDNITSNDIHYKTIETTGAFNDTNNSTSNNNSVNLVLNHNMDNDKDNNSFTKIEREFDSDDNGNNYIDDY